MNRDLFRLQFTQPQMSADGAEAEVLLYGEIIKYRPELFKDSPEDKSAIEFDKAIKAVREQGAKKLLLRINSPGGIVTEAIAMRSILCSAGFEAISIRIEGLCASADDCEHPRRACVHRTRQRIHDPQPVDVWLGQCQRA